MDANNVTPVVDMVTYVRPRANMKAAAFATDALHRMVTCYQEINSLINVLGNSNSFFDPGIVCYEGITMLTGVTVDEGSESRVLRDRNGITLTDDLRSIKFPDGSELEYWVSQRTMGEDDVSGTMFFPMEEPGAYLMVGFAC